MKITFPKLLAVILLPFALPAFAQDVQWTTDYPKALEAAKSQNKVVLLDFTGSDWCGWCIRMKEETLDQPAFKRYARKNLVLVEVDFPHKKTLQAPLKQQNQGLARQFNVHSYPTFVLVDKDGKELGRQSDYVEGGPAAFIAVLNKIHKPAPASSSEDDFHSFFNKKPAQSPTP